jgi:methyl-accepting chemotaxis protein
MEDFLMAKDTKDGNNLNEKSYVNKKLLQCYLIISMVLLAAYIMELVKGNRTAGYVFVFSIILIVPVIMAAFAYKKNAESKIVRSITAIGYGILYAFVLWTSVSILSFTYAIPMIIAISMFADKKYTLKVGIASALINIVYIIIQYVNVGITSSDMVDYEIQIAFMTLVVAFSYITTDVLGHISAYKLETIEAEKAKTDDMTATSIEEQSSMTTTIQEAIEHTGKASDQMVELAVNSNDSIQKNIVVMDELRKQSEQITDTNKSVTESMQRLQEKTKNVENIAGMILNISSQTNLLALNASIVSSL